MGNQEEIDMTVNEQLEYYEGPTRHVTATRIAKVYGMTPEAVYNMVRRGAVPWLRQCDIECETRRNGQVLLADPRPERS